MYLISALAVAHDHQVLPLPPSAAVIRLWRVRVHSVDLFLHPQLLHGVPDALLAHRGRRLGHHSLPAGPVAPQEGCSSAAAVLAGFMTSSSTLGDFVLPLAASLHSHDCFRGAKCSTRQL